MNQIDAVRNQKVMLDKDLSALYGVTTGNLNKAVKRNIKRFPDDFIFQLSDEEFKNLIFQTGTSSWGGTRKAPYAFTEQGVAMLSGILNSDRAIAVNIQIMRVFTWPSGCLTKMTSAGKCRLVKCYRITTVGGPPTKVKAPKNLRQSTGLKAAD